MSENANPERGCGTKTAGGTYAEGPEGSASGVLRKWAWLLGDGYKRLLPITVSPRQMIVINPAATIYSGSLVKSVLPGFGDSEEAAYQRLLKKTKNQGVADHVGEKYYSVYSFAEETRIHGPSRRIPKSLAERLLEILWRRGSVPMLFTHNRMPVFDSRAHLETALEHAHICLGLDPAIGSIPVELYDWDPTWQNDEWSQYVEGATDGRRHVLIPILRLIDQLDNDWRRKKKYEPYRDAKEFFAGIRFVEQSFGLSWLAKITHCADEDGNYDEDFLKMREEHGGVMVNLIDLNELEEEE